MFTRPAVRLWISVDSKVERIYMSACMAFHCIIVDGLKSGVGREREKEKKIQKSIIENQVTTFVVKE